MSRAKTRYKVIIQDDGSEGTQRSIIVDKKKSHRGCSVVVAHFYDNNLSKTACTALNLSEGGINVPPTTQGKKCLCVSCKLFGLCGVDVFKGTILVSCPKYQA